MFIAIDELEESKRRYDALETTSTRDTPFNFQGEALIADVPPEAVLGNILGTDENMSKRIEMLEAINQEPVDFALERAIGNNDSVYSNFVELIRHAKQKVGRVAVKEGNRNRGFATGFMVAENLMLTNWHVFKTRADVGDSEIQFFYELDTSGNPGSSVCFKLDSSVFFHSNRELDYCFVAVNGLDTSGKVPLSSIGYIFCDPALGKLGNEDEEALNIIHHPDGDYKQLSIRENLFKKITPISIWYESDTAPGSSGSPVFNDQWQVVALHHMGVGKKNDNGDYIDKDGVVIPKINGKIDAAKVVWIANEGIRISVILKDLFLQFPDVPILKGLQKKPDAKPRREESTSASDNNTPTNPTPNNSNMETPAPSNMVTVSFPASLVEKNGSISFTINQGAQSATTDTAQKPARPTTAEEIEFLEIKRLEETTDFSLCKGYQARFLGNSQIVAMPQPKESIQKFIAKVGGTDSFILKYYHYSTIFHSVRMMPIISAINVDGDLEKRKDRTPRKDVWLRDTRMSFDIQLSDSYYKKSGFQRGHMTRREDANWGATPEEARRNADLTCMYTNACPQVGTINQSSKKGLWGILEEVVLENGAVAQLGKTAKISVFSGPIFKEGDPVFRGIQVPMDFYKIILWLTDHGKLKATAFKLTQVELVDDIDFEQLDIDQNTQFKQFQCSIKWLDEKTKIDFSHLFNVDTFEGDTDDEIEIHSALEVMSHIAKAKK